MEMGGTSPANTFPPLFFSMFIHVDIAVGKSFEICLPGDLGGEIEACA